MSNTRWPPIQVVTPMPPVRSGIAKYSADLLEAIGNQWHMQVVMDGTATGRRSRLPGRPGLGRFDSTAPIVFQVGNSGFHSLAFHNAARSRGVLVLHDVVVHHGRLAEFVRERRGRSYRKLMSTRYGESGATLAKQSLRGHVPADLSAYPLSEDFIEAARVTVVHSQHARALVEHLVPGAKVAVVPMGVPLPAGVDQRDARETLGMPRDAFIVASVTHVNPYKRLDVVIRALSRLLDVVPDALLVVAGSLAPGVELKRIAALYGVSHRVQLLGYVGDEEARLVAQAADVCVNLRHPSTGETSASLLRLIGAGKPVLVTDHETTREYPSDVVLRVPVDAFEEEMVAELLVTLAQDSGMRGRIGAAARDFVAREHSMDIAVEGYRRILEREYGLNLPVVAAGNRHEHVPALSVSHGVDDREYSWIERELVNALAGSGVGDMSVTIDAAVRGIRDLRLDRFTADTWGAAPDDTTGRRS
ncbi:MAG TPA: glycosyltransferase [Thermomicrobiales bacterium]|nr:glycosyltransferase [Thermomicrobiales bacterium]